jgi:hypothetical protein
MNGSMSDANDPRLGIGNALKEAIGCVQNFVCDFKGSGFDVDRDNLAMITLLDLGTHLRLINLITTLGKLFLAVSGLSNCHDFAFTKGVISSF